MAGGESVAHQLFKLTVPLITDDDILSANREYHAHLGLPQREARVDCESATSFEELSQLEGFYSFSFYYPENYFKSTEGLNKTEKIKLRVVQEKGQKYINGFYTHLSMIHNVNIEPSLNTGSIQKPAVNPFENWGMIVYTNTESIEHIKTLFPLARYPKLILAVAHWPRYENPPGSVGNVEHSIMRLLRYHAIIMFPDKYICIRDIDSYFPNSVELGSTDEILKTEELKQAFQYELKTEIGRIQSWEANFVNQWKTDNHPIVMGICHLYIAGWHSDLPISSGFRKTLYNSKTFKSIPRYDYMRGSYQNKSPESKQFEAKDVFKSIAPFGIYAGFLNIGTGFSELKRNLLWKATMLYLYKRYFIAQIQENEVTISDKYGVYLTGAFIGKDERVLLYEWCRLFLPYIHFFYVFFVRSPMSSQKYIDIVDVPEVKVYNLFPWAWYNPKYPIIALNELFHRKRLKTLFERTTPEYVRSKNPNINKASEEEKIAVGLLDYKQFLDKKDLESDPMLESEEPIHFRFSDYIKTILEQYLSNYERFRQGYNENQKTLEIAQIFDPAITPATLDTVFVPRPIPKVPNMMNRERARGGQGGAVGGQGGAVGGANGSSGGGRRKTRRHKPSRKSKKSRRRV